MTFELSEVGQSRRWKLIKILVANISIWTATFIGYFYIPELLSMDTKGAGKIVAFIWFGPAFAVYWSILIGIKEQRRLMVSEDNLSFGSKTYGFKTFNWSEISDYQFDEQSKKLSLPCKGEEEELIIPLKRFEISMSQLAALKQKLAKSCQ